MSEKKTSGEFFKDEKELKITSEELPKEKEDKKEDKKSKWLKWVCIILALLLLLLLCFKGCGNFPGIAPNMNISNLLELDPNAGEYKETPKADNKAQGIAIPGWNELYLQKDTKEVTVDFYNPDANEGKYYLTFEIRLPDNSEQGYEVLYKSGLVQSGNHIQNITLSHELKLGTYDATIHIQPYKMNQEQTATNNADIQTKLIVK